MNVPDTGTLDRSPIDTLVEDIGVEELVALLDLFFDHTAALSAAMDEGFEQADRPTVVRAAHTLKSNAAMLGAVKLSRACASLEDDAESLPWPALRPRIEAVKQLFGEATAALRLERERLAALIQTGA